MNKIEEYKNEFENITFGKNNSWKCFLIIFIFPDEKEFIIIKCVFKTIWNGAQMASYAK